MNMSKIDIKEMSEQQFVAIVKCTIKKSNNPLCPYCQEPLVIVRDLRYVYWTWDDGGNKFNENCSNDFELDPPYCNHCRTRDDRFLSVLSAFEE